MRRKYINYNDIQKEILNSYSKIDNNLNKNSFEREKIDNLEKLLNFVEMKGQVPFTKKIFKDMVKLKFLCMDMEEPPLKEIKIDRTGEVIIGKCITISELLTDFINFVCKEKGHKIGVGDFLINKYLIEEYYKNGYYIKNK